MAKPGGYVDECTAKHNLLETSGGTQSQVALAFSLTEIGFAVIEEVVDVRGNVEARQVVSARALPYSFFWSV